LALTRPPQKRKSFGGTTGGGITARRLLVLLTWCCIRIPLQASAQLLDLDVSAGFGGGAVRAAASGQWRRDIGSRLTLGTGLRLTHYDGEAASYRNQGATTTALPDRLPIDPAVWGLNVMVSAQARLAGSFAAGANIDLVGVAWGPTRQLGAAALEPAGGSLFRYGDNDRGSLNSEFFLAVRVGPRLELRGGMSHYVVGYTATTGTSATRYLRFDTVPFLGVRWRR